MSWLARSIANSLQLDDTVSNPNHDQQSQDQHSDMDDEGEENQEEDRLKNQGRGVREDLSEFKETFSRQFWGVASFLAPPPPPRHPAYSETDRLINNRNLWEMSGQSGYEEDASECDGDLGIRIDSADIRSGISNSHSFVQFGSEDPIGEAVGVTEEVLGFARNISHHPETWLDFPLSEEEDMNDFDMSDAQHKHVLTVEHLAPRLRALRIELCPAHLSEGYFWKVYFVLLHSRLKKHDAELLSTLQTLQARAMWRQELQKRTKPEEPDWFGRSTHYIKESTYSLQEDFDPDSSDDVSARIISLGTHAFDPSYSATTDFETEKHRVLSTEIQFIDKSVIEEEPATITRDKELTAGPSNKVSVQDYYDSGDEWLEEDSELDGYTRTGIMVGNEEEVSFSDLEDDDDCTMPIKFKIVSKGLDTSTKTS